MAGLRERKKVETREAIARAAYELFARDGFERASVARIAERAGVSEATVFNYFPTKEALYFRGFERFFDGMLEAVRAREEGTSAFEAFRAYVLQPSGLLGRHDEAQVDHERRVIMSRVLAQSPSLQRQERQVYDDYTRRLAALLAAERGRPASDIACWVTANALLGIHRALVQVVRTEILQGRRPATIARKLRTAGREAFGALESGLG